MMNEENILQLEYLKDFKTPQQIEALNMGIRALKQIDKIKNIILISPSIIEEDVMKYKMIVEVLNNDEE